MRAGSVLARVAVVAMLAAGCRPAVGPHAAGADAVVGPRPKDVLFLVDFSGSMAAQFPAMRQWIQDQVRATAGNGDRFRIAVIGDQSFTDALPVPALEIPRTGRVLPDRRILGAAIAWWAGVVEDSLARRSATRATDVSGAVCQAARLLAPGERNERELVILSDLEDNRRVAIDTLAYRLDGVRVVAAFVAHPGGDPASFARRLESWRRRFASLGAREVVCYDVAQSLTAGPVLPVGHRH